MIELGSITDSWRNWSDGPVTPTQRLNSLVMTNRWHCNYRAFQEGIVGFRYSILPHNAPFSPSAAARFGISVNQPLQVFAAGTGPLPVPPLQLVSDGVVCTAFKPSDDGKALILRLFGASGKTETVALKWTQQPDSVQLSSFTEKKGPQVEGDIEVPGYGIVTLRVEMPRGSTVSKTAERNWDLR